MQDIITATNPRAMESLRHRRQAPRPALTGDWVKVKCIQSEAFFLVGCEKSAASPPGFGSLALAAYRGDDLVHVGSVGTGFNQAEIISLRKMLNTLRWKRKSRPCPIPEAPMLSGSNPR